MKEKELNVLIANSFGDSVVEIKIDNETKTFIVTNGDLFDEITFMVIKKTKHGFEIRGVRFAEHEAEEAIGFARFIWQAETTNITEPLLRW